MKSRNCATRVLYVEEFPSKVYWELRDYWQLNKGRGHERRTMSELLAEVVRVGLRVKMNEDGQAT